MRWLFLLVPYFLLSCNANFAQTKPLAETSPALQKNLQKPSKKIPLTPNEKIIAAAAEQVGVTLEYDPAYTKLTYPNGDVPAKTGVCADVVIRSFRAASIDLQKELSEDMKKNFSKYPKKWGLKKTDSNIDHRRVPNLMRWFDRKGKSLPITNDAKDFLPGDVVAWELAGGLTHIGIISDIKADDGKYNIVHNIGAGAQIENRLFEWKIIGHFRYFLQK
jgi:uncharacterized protein